MMEVDINSFGSSNTLVTPEPQQFFSRIKNLQQEIHLRDAQLNKLKADIKQMKTEIHVRDIAIGGLKNENEQMLAMIRRLVCSYEADYEFKSNVEDFLRKNTDFRGTMHSSCKLSFHELTELRGGQ